MQARRLRVLLVAPSVRYVGGQAIQAINLFGRMREDGQVEIDILPADPKLPGPLAGLQRIKYVRTFTTTMWYVATLLLRVPAYDVIHIFSASYWSFLLAPGPALIVARLYGKKTVLNYRSGQADDHLRNWRTALPVVRLANRVVTPSGYLVDVFARFGVKAQSIYNFVDTTRFRFRLRKPPRPVFLSNRSLEPLYNVGCILRAFALIQKEHAGARLLVAGDGTERRNLEELSKQLGLRNVEFLGAVDHGQMHELYNRADIYLNSPNIDNMPVSIIEAYASGLAVATTDAGGIPYIVRHEETGLLVPAGDSEALAAAAMRYLADEELAARLVLRARDECRQYVWEAVRDRWLALYRELDGRMQ